ncbi:hypothetical protein ALC57_04881 [Trachymyrmex cornetzi]|uniref:Uncharacterized protein n=1 Tax=Trachymyrmex cornetzi TaxID=471704 RepID=A0A195EDC5_9HYME|nr:hypothetical protein ALC57_04881 [Trachymyrmex cornetzi]
MTVYCREWLERHCKEKKAFVFFLLITCAYCDKVFIKSEKNYIRKFINHLYDHGLTELDGHSRCKELKEKFQIMQNQRYVGVCKDQMCKLQIIFFRGTHLLQNHLEIYHGNRSSIYKNVIRRNMRVQHILLNNYLIIGKNNAQCLICKGEASLRNLELQIEETLDELKNHWAKHFRNTQLDEIYRLEQLQQRMDEKLFLEELQILPDDIREMRNYFKFTSEEINEIKNFDEIIHEAVDRQKYIEIFITFKIWAMSSSEGICICCLRKVMYGGSTCIIKNHWELNHGVFSQIYKEIIDIKMVHDLLNQYIIMSDILVCFICRDSFEVKALLLNVEEQLVILLKHCYIHARTSSDDQIKLEAHLRKKFRRKLNTKEKLVEMLENSGRDDQGQKSSDRDEDAITEPSEQSGSSISIDAGADCKDTVNFALSSRQSGERQSTPAQSPSKSDSSNGSPPVK